MLQSSNDGSVVLLYSRNKNWSNREDRVVGLLAMYQRIKNFGKTSFQLDQHWRKDPGVFDDHWL